MKNNIKTILKGLTLILILLLITYWIVIFTPSDNKNIKSSLPQFSIHIDTNNLNFHDYIKGNITYINSQKVIQFDKKPIGIKYRGNKSAHYSKKNFSLKFSSKTCFDNTICHKKWKLNAEYIDKTFMRNKLSYDLFRLFSNKNMAPKINYTTVNLNNSYRGIYTLTERVDKDLLKFIKNDTNAVLFKQPPISNPPAEHHKRHKDFIAFSNWNDFYKDFPDKAMEKLIKRVYYNQRFPNVYKNDKKYLIHELTEFIFNSSNKEFNNKENFNKHFNINNIIDWHLLLLITNNHDGLGKNFYIFRQGTDKPFNFCPWDYDHSFGRDGDGELNQNSFLNTNRVALLNRLLESNAFNYRKKILDKFLLLQKNNVLTTKNINKMIDDNITLISPYIEENEKKWPLDNIPYFKGSNFHYEISLMKNWIEKRLPKVENYLLKLQK